MNNIHPPSLNELSCSDSLGPSKSTPHQIPLGIAMPVKLTGRAMELVPGIGALWVSFQPTKAQEGMGGTLSVAPVGTPEHWGAMFSCAWIFRFYAAHCVPFLSGTQHDPPEFGRLQNRPYCGWTNFALVHRRRVLSKWFRTAFILSTDLPRSG